MALCSVIRMFPGAKSATQITVKRRRCDLGRVPTRGCCRVFYRKHEGAQSVQWNASGCHFGNKFPKNDTGALQQFPSAVRSRVFYRKHEGIESTTRAVIHRH